MKTVKDLMSSFPYFCKEGDSLKFVASRMSISAISFIPVVDEDERVVGTVTFDTICKTIKNYNLTDKEVKVKEIMNSEPIVLHDHDDEATALKQMRSYHLSYVPVIDNEYHLKGMISFMTIARRLVELKQTMQFMKMSFS